MDKIGIYCPSIFPDLWMDLYDNLCSQNKTDIEILFVGDVFPKFKLPLGMKYIYSTVKPAQCCYIGATRVDGDFLCAMSDDVVLSPGALDYCLDTLKQSDLSKTIVTPRYLLPMDFYGDNTYLDIVPNLSIGGIVSRELWNRLGIDRNFVTGYWCCDQAMQVWAMEGGQIPVCEKAHLTDRKINNGSRLCNWGNGYDRNLFYSFWTHCQYDKSTELYPSTSIKKEYPPVLVRQRPNEPIVESPDILTISQGPKGKWT
jgi:hypothetical protein